MLSYYTTTVRVSPEGDVHVSDETIEGLGTIKRFLRMFFASLLLVKYYHPPPKIRPRPVFTSGSETQAAGASSPPAIVTAAEPIQLPTPDWTNWNDLKLELIACVPSTGYFAAGGLAGVISRTATAPLDRLKVYLIASTKSSNGLQAVRPFSILGMVRSSYRTFAFAIRDLWAAGGIQSLYAGESILPYC